MLVQGVYSVPAGARRGCQSPGTRVIDGCELLCGCQELNLDPEFMVRAGLLVAMAEEPHLSEIHS